MLEGPYSPGDYRGTAGSNAGKKAIYRSKNESHGRDGDIHPDNTAKQAHSE